jgi:hypothetical protein
MTASEQSMQHASERSMQSVSEPESQTAKFAACEFGQ